MTQGRKLSKAEREARKLARSAPAAADELATVAAVLERAARADYDAAAALAEGCGGAQRALLVALVRKKRFRQAAHHCRRSTRLDDEALRDLARELARDGEWLGAAWLSHARGLSGECSVGELALACAGAPAAAGGGVQAAIALAEVSGARLVLELARTLLRSPLHQRRANFIAHSVGRCVPPPPGVCPDAGEAAGGALAWPALAHLAAELRALPARLAAPAAAAARARAACELLGRVCARSLWPDARAQLFGSHALGLATAGSDADVCLLLPSAPSSAHAHQRAVLSALAELLRGEEGARACSVVEGARVPLLRVRCCGPGCPAPRGGGGGDGGCAECVRVDVVVNNTAALCNTALLSLCLEQCGAMRPLCAAAGLWARAHALSGPSTGAISSYFRSLLVLRFLQQRELLPRAVDTAAAVGGLTVARLAARPTAAREALEAAFTAGGGGAGGALGASSAGGKAGDDLGRLFVAFALYWAGAGTGAHPYRRMVGSVRGDVPKAERGWGGDAGAHAAAQRGGAAAPCGPAESYRLSFEDPIETERDLGARVPPLTVRWVRCGLLLLGVRCLLDARPALADLCDSAGPCSPRVRCASERCSCVRGGELRAGRGCGAAGCEVAPCADGESFLLARAPPPPARPPHAAQSAARGVVRRRGEGEGEEEEEEGGEEERSEDEGEEGEGETGGSASARPVGAAAAGGGEGAGAASLGAGLPAPSAAMRPAWPPAAAALPSAAPLVFLVASAQTCARALAALRAALGLSGLEPPGRPQPPGGPERAQPGEAPGEAAGGALLALDCEGVCLSRHGELCTVQLAAVVPAGAVRALLGAKGEAARGAEADGVAADAGGGGRVISFVLDMRCAERGALVACLRELLSSPRVRKAAHDCRADGDALLSQLGVRLAEPLLDTQLAHAALEARAGRRAAAWELASLDSLLAQHLAHDEPRAPPQPQQQPDNDGGAPLGGAARGGALSAAAAAFPLGPLKRLVKLEMARSVGLWTARPLSRALVRYAAADAVAALLLAHRLGPLVAAARLERTCAEHAATYLGVRDARFSAESAEGLEARLGGAVSAYVLRCEPARGALLAVAPAVCARLSAAQAALASPPLRRGELVACTLLALSVAQRRAHVRLLPAPRSACAAPAAAPEEGASAPPAVGQVVSGQIAFATGSGVLLYATGWPTRVVHGHLPSLFGGGCADGAHAAAELLAPETRVRAEVVACAGVHVHARLLL